MVVLVLCGLGSAGLLDPAHTFAAVRAPPERPRPAFAALTADPIPAARPDPAAAFPTVWTRPASSEAPAPTWDDLWGERSPWRSVLIEPPVRLGFAGDLSLSIDVGLGVEAEVRDGAPADFPFGAVRDRILAADLAVGNLECVVSPLGLGPADRAGLRAPPQSIPLILEAGFDLVGIANNHVLDYGPEAFADMRDRLDRAGLAHIGAGERSDAPEAPLVRELRGVRVGFLAYYEVDPPKAYADVARARPLVDVLVVYNHWGAEYDAEPIAVQRSFGHGLVDAGADLVVGAHVHKIQPEEWYRGKLIFYGLGNFVFGGMGHDEALRTGAWLEVDVNRQGIVARRVYRARLDQRGAPRWLDEEPWTPREITRRGR